jgi:O-antigen ligase
MPHRIRASLVVPLCIAAAWLSIIPGQILRWQPAGRNTGLVLSDAVAVVLGVLALGLMVRRPALRNDPAVRLAGLFLSVMVLSWAVAAHSYGRSDIVQALGYVVRLLAYFSAFVVAMASGKSAVSVFVRYGALAIGIVFVLGVFILSYLPDFAPLAAQGWDPHVGRFTSTWLDPNYIGSFLALAFSFALAWEAEAWKQRMRWAWLVAFMALCAIGIQLTFSRSALVTLAVAAGLVALRTSWRAVVLAVVALGVIIVMPGRFHGRIASSVNYVNNGTTATPSPSPSDASTDSGNTQTSANADPTASARVDSWKRALTLTKGSPILGVGYNFYAPATVKRGLISAKGETRGTAGSDSSLLTILATTGVAGLAAFCGFFGYLALRFIRLRSAWAVAGFGLIGGMFVGSQFNNLLLYPLALLPFMIALGLAYREANA